MPRRAPTPLEVLDKQRIDGRVQYLVSFSDGDEQWVAYHQATGILRKMFSTYNEASRGPSRSRSRSRTPARARARVEVEEDSEEEEEEVVEEEVVEEEVEEYESESEPEPEPEPVRQRGRGRGRSTTPERPRSTTPRVRRADVGARRPGQAAEDKAYEWSPLEQATHYLVFATVGLGLVYKVFTGTL